MEAEAISAAEEGSTPRGEAGLRSEVSRLFVELEEQRFARELVEAHAQKIREERDELMGRLRKAERAQMLSEMQVRTLTNEVSEARRRCSTGSSSLNPGPPSTIEDVVKSLVTLELEQLRNCLSEERVATKRRLLLRWHPDKNSGCGGGGSDLATRVVQEMQSRSEWSDKT
jgi:hypothetical protein